MLRELGVGADTAVGLCNLGWMALSRNDLNEATDYYEESYVSHGTPEWNRSS